MKDTKIQGGRRAFLRGSMRRLVVAPIAAVAAAAPLADAETSAEDTGDGVLPGDPGYRDPETYGNLATYGGDNDAT